jgi:tetratricopeptide (TPR) repeat protein
VAHLEAGKPADAIVALNESIHKDPENAVAYMKLGSAYCATHQYTEAIAVFKMAIEIKREVMDADAYYQLGQAYSEQGKHTDALAALKQALYISRAETLNGEAPRSRNTPSAVQLHYTLGSAYHRLSKFKEAIQELRIVIDINPKIAEAHFGLAVCYLSIGDRKSAEKEQKILATLNPALAQKIADALFSNNRITPPGVTDGLFGKR